MKGNGIRFVVLSMAVTLVGGCGSGGSGDDSISAGTNSSAGSNVGSGSGASLTQPVLTQLPVLAAPVSMEIALAFARAVISKKKAEGGFPSAFFLFGARGSTSYGTCRSSP